MQYNMMAPPDKPSIAFLPRKSNLFFKALADRTRRRRRDCGGPPGGAVVGGNSARICRE